MRRERLETMYALRNGISSEETKMNEFIGLTLTNWQFFPPKDFVGRSKGREKKGLRKGP